MYEGDHRFGGNPKIPNIDQFYSGLWNNNTSGIIHTSHLRQYMDIPLPPQTTNPLILDNKTRDISNAKEAKDILTKFQENYIANYCTLAARLRELGYAVSVTEIAPMRLAPADLQSQMDVTFGSNDKSKSLSNDWDGGNKRNDWGKKRSWNDSNSGGESESGKKPRYNNDRYGDNDRFERRGGGRGGGGFRGRGGRGGRGRDDYSSNNNNNGRYQSQNYSSGNKAQSDMASGWSDDESKGKDNETKKTNNAPVYNNNGGDDDWDEPAEAVKPIKIEKEQPTPMIQSQTSLTSQGEDWD